MNRPRLPSSPTGYRTVVEQAPRVELEQTPPQSSVPPQGELQLRGHGWKLSMPWAVILALGSAIGARYLPTNTSTDVKVDAQRAEQAARDRREEERWEDVRAWMRGMEQRLGRLEDARVNDRAILEEQIKQIRSAVSANRAAP